MTFNGSDARGLAFEQYNDKISKYLDDVTYGNLKRHFSKEQIIDICLTVGYSNMVNRFHATFLTDIDEKTLSEVEAGNSQTGSCPIPLPEMAARYAAGTMDPTVH